MDYVDSISYVVGEEYLDSWLLLSPDVYYKFDKPYGLIATVRVGSITYVASTAIDNGSFTKSMIAEIIRLYKSRRICLITSEESAQGMIRRYLSRYDFNFKVVDSVLYSYGGI